MYLWIEFRWLIVVLLIENTGLYQRFFFFTSFVNYVSGIYAFALGISTEVEDFIIFYVIFTQLLTLNGKGDMKDSM